MAEETTTTAATTTADTTTAATTNTAAEGSTTTATTTTAPVWGDDWRQTLAGDDGEAQKLLARYNDPQSVVKKLVNQEKLIRSGEYKKTLGDKATPEELAEYRKASGIPEKPEGYDLTGVKLADEDKAVVGELLSIAHATNQTPAQVKATLGWLTESQAKIQQAHEERVAEVRKESVEALRAKWGGEFRPNMQMSENFLAGAPKEVQELLKGATDADGVPLGAKAEWMEWIASIARENNPLHAVVGAGGLPAVGDELAKLKKEMGTDAWFKGPDAEKKQARYRELIRARDRFAS